jgi:hypothetical protein
VIPYIRRNMVAFVALFIAIISFGGTAAYAANTIRSSDIVDGQVKNQDLADNAVGTKKIQDGSVLGADIKDNSLGGADIKESTLGQVPNAKTVDGRPIEELQHTTVADHDETDLCTQPGVWSECAGFQLTVPTGHQYTVTVTSSITANPGLDGQDVSYCPATSGPTCITGNPELVSLPGSQYTNSTTAATVYLSAGTYTLSTAVKVQNPLFSSVDANTATTVSYEDVALMKSNLG